MATDPHVSPDFAAGFYAGLYAAAFSAESFAQVVDASRTPAETLQAFATMLRKDAKSLAKQEGVTSD